MVESLQFSAHDSLSRRAVLAGALAVSAGAALGACKASSGYGSAAGGGPSAGSSGAAAPPTGQGGPIVALTAVPVGGSVSAQLNGQPIIVSQPTAGKAVAFTAICTHMGCTVQPAGATLHCPCHGSVYNALTGANISGPAPRPLAEIPVKVSKGSIVAA
ncbi:MAG: hypothetical protein JWP61_1365 [Friedmanniella sp.]|nr:hypothetical protein [Friedmanniella sp.]